MWIISPRDGILNSFKLIEVRLRFHFLEMGFWRTSVNTLLGQCSPLIQFVWQSDNTVLFDQVNICIQISPLFYGSRNGQVTDRQTNWLTAGQTDRQIDWQLDRQTDGWTDRLHDIDFWVEMGSQQPPHSSCVDFDTQCKHDLQTRTLLLPVGIQNMCSWILSLKNTSHGDPG